MTGTAIVTMTGEQNLDALLSGVQWDGIVASYGFPGAKEDYVLHLLYGHPVNTPQGWGWANETDGFSPLNEDQKDGARNAFAAVDSYVNLTAVEQELAPGSADMRLAMSTVVPGNTAYTIQPLSYSPLGAYQGGDIWFNTMDFNNPQVGTYRLFGAWRCRPA